MTKRTASPAEEIPRFQRFDQLRSTATLSRIVLTLSEIRPRGIFSVDPRLIVFDRLMWYNIHIALY